jgi:hypothetical protein
MEGYQVAYTVRYQSMCLEQKNDYAPFHTDTFRVTRLPVVVKGILTGEDALLAAEHGARAVLVSNHGGRQLDSVPATVRQTSRIQASPD